MVTKNSKEPSKAPVTVKEPPIPEEPVYTPVDDKGNTLPILGVTDLCKRAGIFHTVPSTSLNPTGALPEAGGITFADVDIQSTEHGLVVQVNKIGVTARAATPIDSLENLFITLARLEELGIPIKFHEAPRMVNLKPAQPALASGNSVKAPVKATTPTAVATTTSTAAKPATVAKPVVTAKPSTASQVPIPTPDIPPEPPGPEQEEDGQMSVEKITVTPLAGNLYVLGFYEKKGYQYPTMSTYKDGMKEDATLAFLNESGYEFTLGDIQVTKPVSFEVSCLLGWKNSKTLKKQGPNAGMPYQNPVRLYPVGA